MAPTLSPSVGKPRMALFRALGRGDAPEQVFIDGVAYRRLDLFKHDSWAATALYEGPAGKVVCKFNRQQSILGLPMRWLGRLLARREADMLRRLAGVPGIPGLIGEIRSSDQALPHAVGHVFIEGRPLSNQTDLDADFFPRLTKLLDEVHNRGIAYVDLHKRENVIVGADRQPYLIDFQVSVALAAHGIWKWTPARALLRVLQRIDRYHLLKHVLHCSAERPSRSESDLAAERPWWIKAHRLVAVPLRETRRRLLVLLGIRRGRGRAQTECFCEDGLRHAEAR